MIEDTINSILEAEDKAKKITDDALKKGRDIYVAAETQYDAIKQAAILEVKNTLKHEVSVAEIEATQAYEEILKAEKEKLKAYADSIEPKIDGVADYVVNEIKKEYGNC